VLPGFASFTCVDPPDSVMVTASLSLSVTVTFRLALSAAM